MLDGMVTWLVEVALPVPLRQTFTYRVPMDLDGSQVKKGYRVLVPFRSRLMYGLTMSDACAATEVDPKIRALNSYDGRQRLLAPDIERLLDWMVRYYRAPVGEAVKMALPPGTLHERDVEFRLTSEGESHVHALPEARILGLLGSKSLAKKDWESKAQAKVDWKTIRGWESEGYLEMVARGHERDSIPHVAVVELTPAGGAVALDELARSPKQQELLIWLRDYPSVLVASSEIGEHFKSTGALLDGLEKKGYVRRRRVPKHELELQATDFEPDDRKRLTPEQDEALRYIVEHLDTKAYAASLIFGVTGAGKTEVYLRAIEHCLDLGRQALFLVPEIGLTPLMQRRIVDRFGDRLAILHSAVGAGRRAESWARVLAGKVDVVLGARSGIFAPLPRLGLVIVDEEHDGSYKQNDGIRYQGRDLALVRAKLAGAAVVLGSATPSLESWHNTQLNRMRLLTIKKRATAALMPEVAIVDMREEFKIQRRRPVLSNELAQRLEMTLGAGFQAMILLNRRGYFSFMLCRKCGDAVGCSQCEVSLTYHHTDRTLRCHYCGETRSIPEACPMCESPATMMQFFGEGTQQIQEYIQKLFPDYVVDRLDRDRLTKRDEGARILADFGKKKSHVLVGTQMIAKGHDFPNVTLVGILNADQGLRIPDFRAAEVTFQLLTQVAGRSGRGQNPGTVVIQTYMPEHYSITAAAKHDFPTFLEREIRFRKAMFYAPFAHMVALLITDEDANRGQGVAQWMAEQLHHLGGKDLVVLGPSRAPIGKIKGAWRFQIVVKSGSRPKLHQCCDVVVEEVVTRKMLARQAIIMDIDPYQFF